LPQNTDLKVVIDVDKVTERTPQGQTAVAREFEGHPERVVVLLDEPALTATTDALPAPAGLF